SRGRILRRGTRRILARWRLPIGATRIQPSSGFSQFFRNLAEKDGGALFRFGSEIVFHELAQARQFFIELAAHFFEFVHLLAPESACRRGSNGARTIPVL